MRFIRLVAMDIREGFAVLWRWYAVSGVFFVLCIASLYLQAAAPDFSGMRFTLGDYLVNDVAGMKQFIVLDHEPFRFPVAWAVMFLLVAYVTLWYPYRDLMGSGKQVVIAGGSRWAWWLAKCVWVMVAVGAFFILAFAVASVWTFAAGGEYSVRVSERLPELLAFSPAQVTQPPYEVLSCLLGVPVVTAALCLIQLLLSLLIRPALSYAVTVAILFLSAFYFNPWLIGNYLMAARSAALMQGGVDAVMGLTLSVTLIVAVSIGGGLVFSHMDILNKEDLS